MSSTILRQLFMQAARALDQGHKIVAIGGGNGLGRVMSSLGFLGDHVTGIVTTTDNGGSAGRLREASGCIAWGDFRNCLNQLCSDSTNLSRMLFEYRFKNSGELSGHVLGNLMLLAVDQMCLRPLHAVNLIRNMLQVEALLIPMSEKPASLTAIINGKKIIGETQVDLLTARPDKLVLLPNIEPTREAVEAIAQADMIILGPGSFMTSVLPALLMKELAEAIIHSNALKVFIGNINPENSAIKKLSIAEQLDWMEYMTGVYPDTLLWPKERQLSPKVKCHVYAYPLIDADNPAIHCRRSLQYALEHLAKHFLTAAQSKINSKIKSKSRRAVLSAVARKSRAVPLL